MRRRRLSTVREPRRRVVPAHGACLAGWCDLLPRCGGHDPPLIVFLTAIPVYVARVVHVTEPAVFKAFVFGAGGISTFASISLVRRIVEDESSRAVLTVLLVFLLFPFTKGDFGQREHLTVLLVLPYVLATAAWAVGRPSTERIDVMTGVVAGLGFAMKPVLRSDVARHRELVSVPRISAFAKRIATGVDRRRRNVVGLHDHRHGLRAALPRRCPRGDRSLWRAERAAFVDAPFAGLSAVDVRRSRFLLWFDCRRDNERRAWCCSPLPPGS